MKYTKFPDGCPQIFINRSKNLTKSEDVCISSLGIFNLHGQLLENNKANVPEKLLPYLIPANACSGDRDTIEVPTDTWLGRTGHFTN